MAKKRDIRQRAFDALGDFSGYVGEDVIRDKMVQIFKDEAKAAGIDDTSVSMAAAIIARDGNLKALGRERIEDFYLDGKPEEKPVKPIAGKNMAAQKLGKKLSGMARKAEEQAETKAKKQRQRDEEKESGLDADGLPVIESAAIPSSVGAKRKRGRPKKHDNGGQISIWFDDDTKAKIERIVKRNPNYKSFSDVVNGLIKAGLEYLGEDK